MLVMTIAGLFLLVRSRLAILRAREYKLFTIVFVAVWLSIALSLPDAVNPQRTLVVTVNHLRFFLSGVFIIYALANLDTQTRFLQLCAWLLAFWVLDALVQMVFGADIFGREGWRQGTSGITGVFGPEGKTFGVKLAVLSPLLLVYAHKKRWPLWGQCVCILATVAVVISAGSRAAWVALAAVGLFYVVYLSVSQKHTFRKAALTALVLSTVAGGIAYQVSDAFNYRVNQSVQDLTKPEISGSTLGHRWMIWRGAWNMIKAHPMNGVGARGFRYAFGEFAAPGDPYVERASPILPTHSHQLLLEITAETGLIGLCGWLVACVLLIRAALRSGERARESMLPFGIGLAALLFPLNTHWAIYSANMSQLVWWLIALFCSAYAMTDPHPLAPQPKANEVPDGNNA